MKKIALRRFASDGKAYIAGQEVTAPANQIADWEAVGLVGLAPVESKVKAKTDTE